MKVKGRIKKNPYQFIKDFEGNLNGKLTETVASKNGGFLISTTCSETGYKLLPLNEDHLLPDVKRQLSNSKSFAGY